MATADDVPTLARLHTEGVTEGFLPTLGPAFLGLLYRRVLLSDGSFAIVAEIERDVVGFVAATESVRALYRVFLVHDGLRAAVTAPGRLLRAVPKVVETLRYPAQESELPPAEILVVSVSASARGAGIGHTLVTRAVADLEGRGISAVRVVTTAANEPALRMYRSAGFRAVHTTEVHQGTESVVLVRSSVDDEFIR